MARLLFILDNLEVGGVERNTIHICNYMAEAGHDITLLCLTQTGPMAEFVSSKVTLQFLGVSRARYALFELIPYLRHYDFDAVISAKEYANVITLLASLLTFKKIRVIVTTRTHLISEKENGKSKMFALTLFLARFFYPFAYKRVAVSKGVAQSVKDALHDQSLPVEVIYNPAADPHKFAVSPPSPHPWFTDPDEIPVIVTCGRLSLAKDYAFLLDSFAELLKTTKARLIIVGDGELRAELEEKIQNLHMQNSVLLYGFASNPEDFMFHARLFALTSKWEGFGNVLVEALAMGCPIVAMDCPGGVREILEDGKWGRLVVERSPEAFARSLATELKIERPSRLHLQARARDFMPEKIAADYLALLD